MQKIVPCLWYDGDAEEAAAFYVTLFPNSRIDNVVRSPADNPSMAKGGVLVVDFTLDGQKYTGLNGGPQFRFTEAVSFQVHCDDQAEVDRLWDAIEGNGGKPSACGWISDRWGLSWQITPRELLEMIASDDRAAAERAMQAMLEMVKLDLPTLRRAFEGG
ncbi:MAG TPA: VOC family protein [Allosphingosinicella sp.]|jgi:predicted 3-demethylubiquinone-9 3-methyltransferase (glyoxalase superfamily)